MTATANIFATNGTNVLTHALCASVWQDGKRVGENGGQKLLKQLPNLARHWQLKNDFSLQEVECMSACNHFCVVAFAGSGKLTCVFGDLPVDGSASAILERASFYYIKPDGFLPWLERRDLSKKDFGKDFTFASN